MVPEHGSYYDNLSALESLRVHRTRSRCESLLALLDLRDHILGTQDQKSHIWLLPIVNRMIDEAAQDVAGAAHSPERRADPEVAGARRLWALRGNAQEIALKLAIEVCFIVGLARFVWHHLTGA